MLSLSKKFFNKMDYLSHEYQPAIRPATIDREIKLTFRKPGKAGEYITDLQQIASIVNGLEKPIFNDVIKYHNCHKKIEIINQLIIKKGTSLAHIDLKSFYLSFETILNQWCNESPERRTSAREKIWNFYISMEETILDLSHFDLTSLPDIFQFEPFQNRLIELDLSYNCFRHLPDSLGTLRKLKQLLLFQCNKLEDLPDLSNLKALRKLSIACKNLRSVPALGNLQALTSLLLSGNFTSVPALGNLQALTSLTLSGNFTSVPDSLGNLHGLESLYIYDCKNLRRLPDLSNLQALTHLEIYSDSLRELPDLSNLQVLRELYISCNNLNKVACFLM